MMKIIIYILYTLMAIYPFTIIYSAIKRFRNLSEQRKKHDRYVDLTRKIIDFLHEHKGEYQPQVKTMIEWLDHIQKDQNYDEAYDELYSLFKNILPEFIRSERDKKLKSIL